MREVIALSFLATKCSFSKALHHFYVSNLSIFGKIFKYLFNIRHRLKEFHMLMNLNYVVDLKLYLHIFLEWDL